MGALTLMRWPATTSRSIGLQIGGAPSAAYFQQLRDRVRPMLDGDIECGETVAAEDIGIGAVVEKQRRECLAIERRGPMQRRGLRDLPVIDAAIDRRRLVAK